MALVSYVNYLLLLIVTLTFVGNFLLGEAKPFENDYGQCGYAVSVTLLNSIISKEWF